MATPHHCILCPWQHHTIIYCIHGNTTPLYTVSMATPHLCSFCVSPLLEDLLLWLAKLITWMRGACWDNMSTHVFTDPPGMQAQDVDRSQSFLKCPTTTSTSLINFDQSLLMVQDVRGHRRESSFYAAPTGASCSSVSQHKKESKTTAAKCEVGKVVWVNSESSDEFQGSTSEESELTVTFSAKTHSRLGAGEKRWTSNFSACFPPTLYHKQCPIVVLSSYCSPWITTGSWQEP